MSVHEDKYCPRCNKVFECKVGNITQCQCYGLSLSDEERAYISTAFSDCICRECLLQMKNDFINSKHRFISQAKNHR
ncbi:cysteine-rich CWC family protein [Ferruginibacter sp. SUN106]|uniref:cysteine-rich CWC family protein n=1 Tax=Ferruginibacter sp. SUN106 TaxID=2978348 RepID=UPI003D35BEDC